MTEGRDRARSQRWSLPHGGSHPWNCRISVNFPTIQQVSPPFRVEMGSLLHPPWSLSQCPGGSGLPQEQRARALGPSSPAAFPGATRKLDLKQKARIQPSTQSHTHTPSTSTLFEGQTAFEPRETEGSLRRGKGGVHTDAGRVREGTHGSVGARLRLGQPQTRT